MAGSVNRKQKRGSIVGTSGIQRLNERIDRLINYVPYTQSVMTTRTSEVDRMSREMIEYRQRYLNQTYDNLVNNINGIDFSIPPDATITGFDYYMPDRYIDHSNRSPSANDRLCSQIFNANGMAISLAILMEAYQQAIPFNIRTEPDGLWAEIHTYARVRQLITEMPGYGRIYDPLTDTLSEISFRLATLHRDQSIPRNEILLFNSQHPEYSIRIINIGEPNVP